jgi:hypothetical protein
MNNFTLVCTLVISCFTSRLVAQKTFYVSPEGKGNGTSWTNAFGELQDALKISKSGDQIWVAEGMYFPTTSTDRSISFQINDGVSLYGGFKGNEKNIVLRDPIQNPTILSGNIGNEGSEDNSYNVVYTNNVSNKTVVEGFIIVGGYASYEGQPTDRRRSGGAWFNDGSNGGQSNPTIIACVFMDNFAKDGGALYNNGKKGEASPTIVNCTFQNNSCDLDGGALYNDGRLNGKSSPVLKSCKFLDNKGNYGGVVFNYGLNGDTTPNFYNCVFSTNNAYVKGGAVFHMSNDKLNAASIFGESVFNSNSALDHDSDDVHHYLISDSQVATR